MKVGEVYRNDRHYLDPATGQLLPKHLIVLGFTPGHDIVTRLLTSRAHGRPIDPRCYHGRPYGGFFVGVLGGPLTLDSWVDLRAHDDLDRREFELAMRAGTIRLELEFPNHLLVPMLECVAGADDTTLHQERVIRDAIAKLR